MILSSKPRDEVSLLFTNLGALGFIARSGLQGAETLKEAIWYHGLLPDPNGEIVGNSLPILLALRDARQASQHRENLLIRGERGTGKELFSQYIHNVSCEREKKQRPFVPINSAVFTSDMFSSELFGIKSNIATGVNANIGWIETADGGDMFLDEIGDMPPDVQAGLLRVLQDRVITSVGARKSKEVDVRFISATNINLEDESRGFRSDLLDRLRSGDTLWLPPLRDRKGDIPLLAEKFIRTAEASCQGAMRRDITRDALDLLMSYDWPGNVRELQSCLLKAVTGNPNVEHLVPGHLVFGQQEEKQRVNVTSAPVAPQAFEVPKSISTVNDLDSFFSMQAGLNFDLNGIAQWKGSLGDLEYASASLVAKYLHAALDAIKVTQGQIQILPAMKLVTGDTSLTSLEAYDIIKRLLAPMEEELTGDLKDVYEKAVEKRGKPRSRRLPRKRLFN
jgi:transcriptional regulator with AAA-type ATPase domain